MTRRHAVLIMEHMRHLALAALMLSGCTESTNPLPTSEYGCRAVMQCPALGDTPADFQVCSADREDAEVFVEQACDEYAAAVRCPEWTCAVRCDYEYPCLDASD